MTYTQEEIQAALLFLETYKPEDKEYHKNLDMMFIYLADIIDLMKQYEQAATLNRELRRKLDKVSKKGVPMKGG